MYIGVSVLYIQICGKCVVALQPTLVGTEQPDDSDADLVADDHELNYGERSEHNHRFQETNSVFNDRHVMISPASGQVRASLLKFL